MSGAVAAAAGQSKKSARPSGTFATSAVGPTITSPTITFTIPSPTPRDIEIGNFVDVGAITSSQYSLNGAAFAALPDPTTINMTNTDTLALRVNGCTIGESRTMTITDKYTGVVLENAPFNGV